MNKHLFVGVEMGHADLSADDVISGWCWEQEWASVQGLLQPQQKTAWHTGQGTGTGLPSLPGVTLHTAWQSSTGHQALLGSNWTPEWERKKEWGKTVPFWQWHCTCLQNSLPHWQFLLWGLLSIVRNRRLYCRLLSKFTFTHSVRHDRLSRRWLAWSCRLNKLIVYSSSINTDLEPGRHKPATLTETQRSSGILLLELYDKTENHDSSDCKIYN